MALVNVFTVDTIATIPVDTCARESLVYVGTHSVGMTVVKI